MRYQKTINSIGWLVGAAAFVVYFLTMSPTVCFWDCGEFIATGSKLQVGHPPGAPLYHLLAAVASALSFGNTKLIAPIINSISAVAAAFTIVLFFWSLVRILNRFSDKFIANIIAAAIGALTFAFTDSFWASATEAEVYSLSLLFTIAILWSVLKWDSNPNERWVLLISLLVGLSLGVHILSLLVLPAVLLVVCFHYFKPSLINTIITLLVSALLVWMLLSFIPFLLSANRVVLYVVLFALLVLLWLSIWKRLSVLNTICLSLMFLMIGVSTYLVLVIRADADTPINEYSPHTAEKLNYYLQRNNYEKPPLIYGNQFTAYNYADYDVSENGKVELIYNKDMQSLFPRLWNPAYESAYIDWAGTPEKPVIINGQTYFTPSFSQNLKYFLNYQLGYMYGRYLMWNFVGKTNDIQGFGEANNGQWQSGLPYVDRLIGINTDSFPKNTLKLGSTAYYFIPLLLVVIGVFYHFIRDRKGFIFNAIFFLSTSLAVVVYLNVTPYQPRERDYVFLASFLALSVWLSVGALAISRWIVSLVLINRPKFVLPFFFIVPIWLLSQNYISHNHSRQYTARNFAQSLLESCDEDAILLTNGDNDTFPLWYLQNVENVRTDVRVINVAFLNSPDYIDQLQKQIYLSKPLKVITSKQDYENSSTLNLVSSARSLLSEKPTQIARRLNENLVTRNDIYSLGNLILIDLIVANIDTRPIYFSAYSNEDFLGLENYLALEGFAYRLKNVANNKKNDLLPPKYGTVDANKMYQHFKQFQWRSFKRNLAYFSELERSVIDMYAQYSSFLAYSLYQQKQYEKAYDVIETCTQNLPVTVHKYPHSLAYIAIMYNLLDNRVAAENTPEMANHFLFYTLDYYKHYMQYYFDLRERFQSQERWEAQKIMANWLYLCSFTNDNKLDDLRLSLIDGFFSYVPEFLEKSYKYLEAVQPNSDFYAAEIEKTTTLVKDILAIGKVYEEPIPQPPASIRDLLR
ncbi:MAG: DUF2723 domain-containing protein [Bacteroidales bacterium]|jgi:hypothetical protein|nr:DUF2723 domain-containing protein [Bacteroidales bacterium]